MAFSFSSASANISVSIDENNILFSSKEDKSIEVSVDSTNGNANVKGSIENDSLQGGTGQDTLSGNKGDDLIIGRAGNDLLTGGQGKDSFYFDHPNQGIDTITDFDVSQDLIKVSGNNFGSGLVAGDTIDSSQFRIGSAATDTSDRFIYNSSNGALWFDADGNGSIAPIQIATLGTGLEFTQENISVV
jgi:Ca2+-binding RTX toxin-like protein